MCAVGDRSCFLPLLRRVAAAALLVLVLVLVVLVLPALVVLPSFLMQRRLPHWGQWRHRRRTCAWAREERRHAQARHPRRAGKQSLRKLPQGVVVQLGVGTPAHVLR